MEIVYSLPSGEETSLYVDAVIDENPTVSAEVTLDPVEAGVAITDHVIPNPDQLTLSGVVSNHPLLPEDDPAALARMKGALAALGVPGVEERPVTLPTSPEANPRDVGGLYGLLPKPSRPTSATVRQFNGGGFDRARTVYEELRRIIREGVIVRLVTDFREYPSFVLRELRIARNASNANTLTFTCQAVEVRIVETEIVQIPTAERRGQKQKSRGVQAPKPVEPSSSMATKAIDALTGGGGVRSLFGG